MGTTCDRTGLATHISLALAGRPRPGDAHACHTCDNPQCVNPAHLWWGTLTDNNRDMHAKGRWKRMEMKGEKSPTAKLTEADVLEIRASDKYQYVLAREYGVTQAMISRIMRRLAWTHI